MAFSPTHPPIYLDYAATTPPAAEVIEAVTESMRTHTANPSAAYSAAGDARKAMRLARETLAGMIGCDRNELFFTSGGTEANNWVFQGLSKQHVIISVMEHSSVLEAAANQNCTITLVQPDQNGVIQPETVESAIRPDTVLVSIQYVNNETGVIQPVSQIGSLLRKRRILFHCDAVQAVGHITVNVKNCCVDLLSASAHKLYGPRGIGFLYIRSGVSLPTLIAGGGQENHRRSGTENVPAIEGFRVAAQLAMNDLSERAKREKALLDQLFSLLKEQIPKARLLGENAERAPGVCAVLLPGLPSETAIARLDMAGIMVSGGAACASSAGKPSHVYSAMGLSDQEASCVLRFSVGRHTSTEDIQIAAATLSRIYQEYAR